MPELYVLTTFYKSPTTGKVIMHAYGPWSKAACQRERQRTLFNHAEDAAAGNLYASVCKVLDVKE